MFPTELRYTKEHEWVLQEDGKVRIGITNYAQEELGDVVFVDLPSEGDEVSAGDTFAVVESVKAVSDIYAPVSGRIVEVNQALEDQPELINEEPYGKGWIIVLEMNNSSELNSLLSAEEYKEHIGEA